MAALPVLRAEPQITVREVVGFAEAVAQLNLSAVLVQGERDWPRGWDRCGGEGRGIKALLSAS